MIESYSRDKHKVQTKSQTKPTSQSQQAKANKPKPTSQSQQLETQDVI
jgi:hypothetical protein